MTIDHKYELEKLKPELLPEELLLVDLMQSDVKKYNKARSLITERKEKELRAHKLEQERQEKIRAEKDELEKIFPTLSEAQKIAVNAKPEEWRLNEALKHHVKNLEKEEKRNAKAARLFEEDTVIPTGIIFSSTSNELGKWKKYLEETGKDIIIRSGTYYKWTGTHWSGGQDQDGKDTVRSSVYEELLSNSFIHYKSKTEGKPDTYIPTSAKVIEAILDAQDQRPERNISKEHITFNNGILLRNGSMVPHSKEYYSRIYFDFDYETGVVPERFVKILNDVWEGIDKNILIYSRGKKKTFHDTTENRINFFRRWLGAVLLGEATHHEQALFLFSPQGANGKGTIIKILQGCIPAELKTSLPIQDWKKFMLHNLNGKLLNTVAELPSQMKDVSDRFKSVVSGDEITADRKNQSAIRFRPKAGHIFSINKLPEYLGTGGGSGAIWRRVTILDFLKDFSEREDQDINIADKVIKEEAAKIVCWAIEEVLKYPEDSKLPQYETAVKSVAKEEGSSVISYYNRYLSVCETYYPTDTIYSRYKDWCQKNGRNHVAQNKFWTELCEHNMAVDLDKKGTKVNLFFTCEEMGYQTEDIAQHFISYDIDEDDE